MADMKTQKVITLTDNNLTSSVSTVINSGDLLLCLGGIQQASPRHKQPNSFLPDGCNQPSLDLPHNPKLAPDLKCWL